MGVYCIVSYNNNTTSNLKPVVVLVVGLSEPNCWLADCSIGPFLKEMIVVQHSLHCCLCCTSFGAVDVMALRCRVSLSSLSSKRLITDTETTSTASYSCVCVWGWGEVVNHF